MTTRQENRKLRMRHYKLSFHEDTRTPEGRARVGKFLLSDQAIQPAFSQDEVEAIVNNQLPDKQKPWFYGMKEEVAVAEKAAPKKRKVAAK